MMRSTIFGIAKRNATTAIGPTIKTMPLRYPARPAPVDIGERLPAFAQTDPQHRVEQTVDQTVAGHPHPHQIDDLIALPEKTQQDLLHVDHQHQAAEQRKIQPDNARGDRTKIRRVLRDEQVDAHLRNAKADDDIGKGLEPVKRPFGVRSDRRASAIMPASIAPGRAIGAKRTAKFHRCDNIRLRPAYRCARALETIPTCRFADRSPSP
jgi:hypothetical protein